MLDVRIATHADLAVLLDMMVDFNALEGIAWSRARGEEALRVLIADPKLGVAGLLEEITGESDRATLGYFVLTWGYDLEWNGRDAFLTELYLVPHARGRGAGGTLLARIERIACEHGSRALHLMVRSENDVARRLYASAGYTSPPRIFLTKSLEHV
jgi:ribosomal protein S18 acetylase RimI-like enzyme